MKRLKIAIDGTAGSGKTTTAIKLAERLGYKPIETGGIFRAITYYILKEKIDLKDKERLKEVLEKIEIWQEYKGGKIVTFLNGEDVTEILKQKPVEEKVSEVSKIREVRDKAYEIERKLAQDGGVVMEGRDIGTVVIPDADVKIFLDARKEVRAKRRMKDFKEKNIKISEKEVLEEIEKRDREDSGREIAPLKMAEDAIYIDTSDLNIEEQVEKIYKIIMEKMKNET